MLSFIASESHMPLQSKKKLKFDLPESAEDLTLKILDNYPRERDSASLKKVLGVGQIKYADLVGGQKVTAAVVNTKPYTLLFGKEFIEENLEDMDDLVYLLSHELTHLVLDHFADDILKEFKDRKLGQPAMHIIVDCQVNATVYNSLKEEKYLKFIKDYYYKDIVPYCFFRPDGDPKYVSEGINEEAKKRLGNTDDPRSNISHEDLILKELDPELRKSFTDAHAKLYSEGGISNKELIDVLMPWFEQEQQKQDAFQEILEKLLGNHSDLGKGKSCGSPGLSDLTETVANNYLNRDKKEEAGNGEEGGGSSEKDGGRKAGEGGPKRDQMVEIVIESAEHARHVRKQIKDVRTISPSARIYRAIDQYSPKTATRSVVPNFYDRRTSAIYSTTGEVPVFHKITNLGSKVLVPCYLDVSGSQGHVIPHTIPVVSKLKKLIGNVVFCFSTYVSDTNINVLKTGSYDTSGGTDFNPVLEHILKNRYKQAVILTDGEAYADPKLLDRIKKMRVKITVGWTCSKPSLFPLSEIAEKTFFVFDN